MKPKLEVINDLLGYEGLKIIQRPDIFNFSLDSSLLADFVTINLSCKKIIDLGCGNGYIPLFLTLRTKAYIYGVEIQEEIVDLAKRSVDLNNLNKQIEIINQDIKALKDTFLPSTFDVVITNPPYFIYKESSLVNESIYQKIARHEVLINLDDVVKQANYLLKDGGIFAMVHRATRLLDVLETCRKYHLEVKRLRFVYPKTSSKEALAILIEAVKTKNLGNLKVMPPLYVQNDDDSYTEEVLKIFNYHKEETK